jgi:hypothetical protein
VLVEGVIAPVEATIDKPAGALKVPPDVPVLVGVTVPTKVLQYEPDAYDMVAVDPIIDTVAVAETLEQPPTPAIVYVTV